MTSIQEEDLRLLDGGRGKEEEVGCYDASPTWVIGRVWEETRQLCLDALDAYLVFCRREGYPHSSLLGLDVLFMGVVDSENPRRIIDLRPTLVEGPCCNSYPACPNIDSVKLYKRAVKKGYDPDRIRYPVHPTRILARIVRLFRETWKQEGRKDLPVVAVFTRPYEESEEESAHNIILNGFKSAGFTAFRITPAEKPDVRHGKLYLNGTPIDMVYRRIERIHVPMFYGGELGRKIVEETTETKWINPWPVDDLRSKTIEEKVFRAWESENDRKISRPRTLLSDEINFSSVEELGANSGFAVKRWNSTGGKGVFLHINHHVAKEACTRLYGRYDGRNMLILDEGDYKRELAMFDSFTDDSAIQELRLADARDIHGKKLVYDTRINALYDPVGKTWDFISGISRSVLCGENVGIGNSILTNISSGAEVSPLIMGDLRSGFSSTDVEMGPIMRALADGEREVLL